MSDTISSDLFRFKAIYACDWFAYMSTQHPWLQALHPTDYNAKLFYLLNKKREEN